MQPLGAERWGQNSRGGAESRKPPTAASQMPHRRGQGVLSDLMEAAVASTTTAAMDSGPQDSDNNWVLAGSESLPVETLGPESSMEPGSEGTALAPQSSLESGTAELPGTLDGEGTLVQTVSPPSEPTLPEEPEVKGTLAGDMGDAGPPGPGDTEVPGDVQETPVAVGPELDTQDVEHGGSLRRLPSSPNPKAAASPASPSLLPAWIGHEGHCSSSDDDTDMDVEGLRRRRGREPSPSRPTVPLDTKDCAHVEGAAGELGISLNMCLLGALVLLGLGLLLFSGPVEEVELQVFPDPGLDAGLLDGSGGEPAGLKEQLQAPAPLDAVPSLQNMGLLLDRLAKENQDIRLLQAQLQAQKEELQSLLHQPKGLEEENARLRGALQQGEASQRALELELQHLRARLQGLEADCIRGPDGVCLSWGRGPQVGKATEEQGPGAREPAAGFLEQKRQLEAEAQALRRELERQRQVLGSVQQDLQKSLRDVSRGGPAPAGLAELGQRLAQQLQGLENWDQEPGVSANASSEAWQQKPQLQNAREWGGKEKWRDGQKDWKHKKEDYGRERKKSWQGEGAEKQKESPPKAEKWGNKKDGKGPPKKSGDPDSRERQKHPRWKEGAQDGQGPPVPWEQLLKHRFRAPQGCSGVAECARQEGLGFFGTELAPVRQQELASLLRTYLVRLPWAGQLTQELPLSSAYFGEDGVFRHDRLRFRDFVDALEDSLEEVAVRETGDDDEVDDFEDFIFSHFFGDKALKR
ncbi:pre-B-cell leukemia transcription factor-interacting protein 1 isoform X2 [Ochotona princeps]|uniref:pre-B-cell leukemia transcription factor-interacting protein 1 isoform X2 n=1 Tax=Ochotona princeps TaxID=9978 RepID=UPI002714F3A5|nr:pre-B-cell leukemia transcription factor-interacting protein 1 isoform X2 [Ochotona princeps]